MGNNFYKLTVNLNKLNKSVLDNIKNLLTKNNIHDVNPNQALILSNIGNDPTHVQDASKWGYYLGTNISYSVGDLARKGYIDRLKDNDDKRCAFLVLTEKGKQVLNLIDGDNMSQENMLKKIGIDVNNMNEILLRLQRII